MTFILSIASKTAFLSAEKWANESILFFGGFLTDRMRKPGDRKDAKGWSKDDNTSCLSFIHVPQRTPPRECHSFCLEAKPVEKMCMLFASQKKGGNTIGTVR